jgi:hypothetical protein
MINASTVSLCPLNQICRKQEKACIGLNVLISSGSVHAISGLAIQKMPIGFFYYIRGRIAKKRRAPSLFKTHPMT